LQQFREAIPGDHTYRFLIHDRDSIFSAEVDDELGAFGLKVLRTPIQAPKANPYCERLMGTIRRECLDYVIPLSEKHLRTIMRGVGYPLQSGTTPCELGARYSGFRLPPAAAPKHPLA
jgi:putative transposase